jgi:hypothetical protein
MVECASVQLLLILRNRYAGVGAALPCAVAPLLGGQLNAQHSLNDGSFDDNTCTALRRRPFGAAASFRCGGCLSFCLGLNSQ